MNLENKIKILETEARELLGKKQDTQKLLNTYDMRLLEISGALKSIKELIEESKVEKKVEEKKTE